MHFRHVMTLSNFFQVETLFEMGCDISHREKKGWNGLHLAARNGQPEKARYLLENGINVNATQDQGG